MQLVAAFVYEALAKEPDPMCCGEDHTTRLITDLRAPPLQFNYAHSLAWARA